MLCSDCKKNTAVIFVNKQNEKGEMKTEGYCYDCAKKRGINPLNAFSSNSNLTESDINNMTEQLNSMFKDLSGNLAIQGITQEELEQMSEEMANAENDDTVDENGPKGFAIPLGSIFSGMFGNNSDKSNNSKTTKTKEEKKQNKKLKTLYTYGTNLTKWRN